MKTNDFDSEAKIPELLSQINIAKLLGKSTFIQVSIIEWIIHS